MILNINRDAFAGGVLALFGAGVAIYSFMHYPVGAISRMGPGMFPVMLGIALLLVAFAILLKSLVQSREPVEINVRAGTVILGSLALFALLVRLFGIVPALLVLLLVSNAAVPGRRLVHTAIFSIIATAAIVFIFVYLMGLNLALFRWPA